MNREQRINDLAARLDQLRADHSATNQALMAILQTMAPQQQDAVLARFAALSAEKQQTYEQIPLQKVQTQAAQMQAAESRLYQGLQGAVRLSRPAG